MVINKAPLEGRADLFTKDPVLVCFAESIEARMKVRPGLGDVTETYRLGQEAIDCAPKIILGNSILN